MKADNNLLSKEHPMSNIAISEDIISNVVVEYMSPFELYHFRQYRPELFQTAFNKLLKDRPEDAIRLALQNKDLELLLSLNCDSKVVIRECLRLDLDTFTWMHNVFPHQHSDYPYSLINREVYIGDLILLGAKLQWPVKEKDLWSDPRTSTISKDKLLQIYIIRINQKCVNNLKKCYGRLMTSPQMREDPFYFIDGLVANGYFDDYCVHALLSYYPFSLIASYIELHPELAQIFKNGWVESRSYVHNTKSILNSLCEDPSWIEEIIFIKRLTIHR